MPRRSIFLGVSWGYKDLLVWPAVSLQKLTSLKIQRWVIVAVGAGVKPGYIEAHWVSSALIPCASLNLKVSMQIYVLKSQHMNHQEGRLKTSRKVFDGWTASDIAVGMLSNMFWDASVGALSWFSAQCKALALPSGNISTLLSASPARAVQGERVGEVPPSNLRRMGGFHREPTGEVHSRGKRMLFYHSPSQNGQSAGFRHTDTLLWRMKDRSSGGRPDAFLGWVCWWLYELCSTCLALNHRSRCSTITIIPEKRNFIRHVQFCIKKWVTLQS